MKDSARRAMFAKGKGWHGVKHSDFVYAVSNDESKQINIQPTYGNGRKKGNYEVVVFPNLKKSLTGKTLGYSNKIENAKPIADKYIQNNH